MRYSSVFFKAMCTVVYSIFLNLFDVCRVCSDIPSFVSDICNLHLLSFFLCQSRLRCVPPHLSKEPVLCFISFFCCFSVLNLIDFWPYLYYFYGLLWWELTLFIWDYSSFLTSIFNKNTINFPLITDLAVFHKFWCIVFSFSFSPVFFFFPNFLWNFLFDPSII